MRTVFSLPIVCAFWILTALSVSACSDNDVRDNLEDYYLVAITAVDNSCGDGPVVGTQLIVAVDPASGTAFTFTLGAGLDDPVVMPDVQVDAEGAFETEFPWDVEGVEDAMATMDFRGTATPDELNAEFVLRLGLGNTAGEFTKVCHIAAAISGPPCGDSCDPLR
jgi:hypothetical protein